VAAVLALVGASEAEPAAPAVPSPAQVGSQVGETSADEARLLEEVEASLNRKKGLDAKLEELDGRLKVTQSELTNAQNRLRALVVRQGGTEARLAQLRQQLEAARQALVDQAIAAYTGQSDAGRLTGLILSTPDIGQLATKQSYLRAATATQADLIVNRERLQEQTKDLLEQLAADQARAKAERDAIAARQARLKAERESEATVRYQVSVEIARGNDLLHEVIARRDEFEAKARELEVQSAAIAETIRGRAASSSSSSSASSSSSSSSSGGFGRPLDAIRVASSFGWRIHPIYGDRRMHTGVDLNAGSGAPIRSVAAGEVISAGWLGGYGNAAVVDHGGGVATLYAHMSALLVGSGQRVDKGQVIGRVGCTGSCTGPHLHFEVRVGGNPVDPMGYL
jgi:murein DD-endopeptidase MepM/ murein hydrolase activator NlpD